MFILKEGKEYNQGVAYLDDGTMVVVDNARSRIGRNLDIVVTSVLQTTAGRMIFGACMPTAPAGVRETHRAPGRSRRRATRPAAGRARRTGVTLPPFHWWRTVFFLIPPSRSTRSCCGIVSLVVGARSIGSGRLRARVRAVVGAADPRDERRAHRRAGGAAAAGRPELRLRRESLEHLRHADPVHGAAAAAAHHGQGGARLRAVHRLAPARGAATCWSNRKNPGAGDLQADAADGAVRRVADRVSRRRRARSTAASSRSRAAFSAGDRERACRSCRSASRQPRRDAEGAVDGRARRRSTSPCTTPIPTDGPDARRRARAGRARAEQIVADGRCTESGDQMP